MVFCYTSLSTFAKKASQGLLDSIYLNAGQDALREDEAELKFRKVEEKNSELEKVVVKDKNLVSCDIPKCDLKGDYWKCYIGNHINCSVYLNWKENDSKNRNKRNRRS